MSDIATSPIPDEDDGLPLPAIICIAIGGYVLLIVIILFIRSLLLQRGICGEVCNCCGKEGDRCCECCVSCMEVCSCKSPNMTACLDGICPRRKKRDCTDIILCQCCADCGCCEGTEPLCDCCPDADQPVSCDMCPCCDLEEPCSCGCRRRCDWCAESCNETCQRSCSCCDCRSDICECHDCACRCGACDCRCNCQMPECENINCCCFQIGTGAPMSPTGREYGGYPPTGGYPGGQQGGYPGGQQGGYPGGPYPPAPYPGYAAPQGGGGYPPGPPAGYPPSPTPGYPPPTGGYPPGPASPQGYPTSPTPGAGYPGGSYPGPNQGYPGTARGYANSPTPY